MKTRTLLAFGLALILGAVSARGETTKFANAAFGTPTIDGTLGAGEWTGTWYDQWGASHPFEDSATTDETTMTAPDFAARWQMMHDADNLYLALEVTDDVRVVGDALWGGDCVEIFFDAADSNAEAYPGVQSRIRYDGTTWVIDPGAHPVGAWDVVDENGVWTLEATFAKADGLDTAIVSDTIGFDVKVADNDTSGNNREVNMFWGSEFEGGEHYNNAVSWGDVTLLADGGGGGAEFQTIVMDNESNATLDTTNAGDALPAEIDTFSIQHTLGASAGSNRVVVLLVQTEANAAGNVDIGSVTYNGAAATLVPGSIVNPGSEVIQETSIYYLNDSALPGPGTYDVVITLSAPAQFVDSSASAISLTGVDQSGPTAVATNADQVGTGSSIDINAGTAGSWVLDVIGSGQAGAVWAAGAGQSLVFNQVGSSSVAAGSYEVANSAGTVTMSWANSGETNRLAHSVVVFAPAPSAPPVPITTITANINPPYIAVGDFIVLTAPAGTNYQWFKDGSPLGGATDRVLEISSIAVSDQGSYTVSYNDGTSDLTTPALIISVQAEGSVPVVGLAGLAALMGASALAGAGILRRRK